MFFQLIQLALGFTIVLGDWYHNTKAFELNVDNINEYVGKEKHVILDFFTPWCIYCQIMAEDYNQIWEHYNGASGERKNDILIAKINCGEDRNHAICTIYHVQSFPTILHFVPQDQKPHHQFNQNRQYKDFKVWVDNLCPHIESYEEELIRLQIAKDEINLQIEREFRIRQEEEANRQHLEIQELQTLNMQEQAQTIEDQQVLITKDLTQRKLDEKLALLELQMEEVNEQKKKISDLEQQIEKFENKVRNQKHIKGKISSGVNWQHALVFIAFGTFLGLIVSFILKNGKKQESILTFVAPLQEKMI